ncbi:hypothetical protein G6F24_015736 [Rhizopus arrhizus]|nr:hypothetical protein G6F24_015736 [Rhizopus arrhizus]
MNECRGRDGSGRTPLRVLLHRYRRQRAEFLHHGGGQEGRSPLHVLRRRHGIDIASHEVQARKLAQQRQPFLGRQPAPLRRAHARRAGGVEDVHVEAQVDRALADALLDVRKRGLLVLVEVVVRHDRVADLAPELQHPGHEGTATGANVEAGRHPGMG